MSVGAADAPAPVRRVRERKRVAVRTAPVAGHAHCAIVDGEGNGITSPAPDGHWHRVRGLEVLTVRGHAHELSAQRCSSDHNATGNHPRDR